MSVIGNQPGVSSQRTVLEEVVTGSPKSAFVPQAGYIKGYVDVLVNGIEIDATDFTAADGITVTLGTAAAVGDTVKIKAWLPRGLSDGYLKSEADARFLNLAGGALTGGLTAAGNFLMTANDGNARVVGVSNGTNTTLVLQGGGNGAGALGGNIELGRDGNNMYDAGVSRFRSLDGSTTYAEFNTNGLSLPSGKGIDFSAGSNASGMTSELLDDYERGTWTPVPVVNYGTGSITGYSASGTYTKIGNVVHVKFEIKYITWTGSPVNMGVNGLPFSLNAASENYSSGIAQNLSTGNMYQLEMSPGANNVSVIRRYDNGTAFTNQSVGFDGSATYFV